MELKLIRETFTDNSTIGELFIDGAFFCYTLEDKDRGLTSVMDILTLNKKKIFGTTCIPYGEYKVLLTMSNRFKRLLPEILDVKGYKGVRIHRGNTAADSLGCIIVGYKRGIDTVYESTKAENDLISKLKTSKTQITLIIE